LIWSNTSLKAALSTASPSFQDVPSRSIFAARGATSSAAISPAISATWR
jgi:hypothetical protein